MADTALQIDALWSGLNDPDTGQSYSGAIVAFFEAGTTTPKAVWLDKDKTLPSGAGQTQATLDSNGVAKLFGDGNYKINVYAPSDTGLTTPLSGSIDGAEYVISVDPSSIGYDSVADMRAGSGGAEDGAAYELLGYYTPGDGGGGQFYWDATSTATDNNGTIIKVTSIATGRWKRLVDTQRIKVQWFGIDNTGGTVQKDEIQAVIDLTPTAGVIEFETDAVYDISSAGVGIQFDRQMGIIWNNCTLNFDGDNNGLAVVIGKGEGTRYFEGWSSGHVRLIRTSAISHDGTQTATSQLLGKGFVFYGVQDFEWKGPSYVIGFGAGYLFTGQASIIQTSGMQTQDCFIDFLFNPNAIDSHVNNFVTAIDINSPNFTFNDVFYSDVSGTRGVSIIKNNAVDGINFIGGALQGALKERKVYCEGTDNTFTNVYWDAAGAGTAFEFTATAQRNIIRGGASMVGQTTIDAGLNNHVNRPQVFWIDGVTEIPHFGKAGTIDLAVEVKQDDTFNTNDFFTIPDATSGYIIATLTKAVEAFSGVGTQFDVTNPAGTTFRYTWNAVGDDPGLTGQYGTVNITAGTINAGNKGEFKITGAGTDYFEIDNAAGVVESGKTADVTHWILESAHWVFANDGKVVQVSGTDNTSGGVSAVFRQFSCGPVGSQIRVTNRMQDTAEMRATCWYN